MSSITVTKIPGTPAMPAQPPRVERSGRLVVRHVPTVRGTDTSSNYSHYVAFDAKRPFESYRGRLRRIPREHCLAVESLLLRADMPARERVDAIVALAVSNRTGGSFAFDDFEPVLADEEIRHDAVPEQPAGEERVRVEMPLEFYLRMAAAFNHSDVILGLGLDLFDGAADTLRKLASESYTAHFRKYFKRLRDHLAGVEQRRLHLRTVDRIVPAAKPAHAET